MPPHKEPVISAFAGPDPAELVAVHAELVRRRDENDIRDHVRPVPKGEELVGRIIADRSAKESISHGEPGAATRDDERTAIRIFIGPDDFGEALLRLSSAVPSAPEIGISCPHGCVCT